jgi:hypothetical protein
VPAAGVTDLGAPCDASESVFERFTESARQVVVNAGDAARVLGHGHIGTEHELLGLLADPDSDASRVLKSLGVTADRARERVAEIVPPGEHGSAGQIPFTPRAKKVFELSLREALDLGHRNITPEHLLLALARDPDGIAMQVLVGMGAEEIAIRAALLPLLPEADPAGPQIPHARTRVETSVGFNVLPDRTMRGLLMAAAGRALKDGRTGFGVSDLLAELASDEEAARMLAELGVNVQAMREALDRQSTSD